MKDVIINGITYQGKNRVQLTTVGGGTALFRDEGEILGMESGAITPTEASATIVIPVSSKKTNLVIYANNAEALALATPYINVGASVISGNGMFCSFINVGGTGHVGYTYDESTFSDAEDAAGKSVNCVFAENNISLTSKGYNRGQTWSPSLTYSWWAW